MFRCFDPDDLGNRTSATYGNGASQAFGYDGISRLSSLTVNLSGTANDLTKTFTYNPASQIVTETRSNVAYSQVLANGTQTTVTNGLNQLSTVNGTAAAYDGRGNMTTDPVTGKTYSYLPSNNQLYNIPSPFATFTYDGLDRLANVSNSGIVTNYVTDGTDVVAEYDGSNVLQKRYAFDGSGQPLVQYDSAGNRSWMLADERGSIIALANDSAAMTAIDIYDEYGIPAATNAGTFQYAGMMWLVRPGVYAPTFRSYAQHFGRFNQTDPLPCAQISNLYAYALNDPLNFTDRLGLQSVGQDIIVTACQNGGYPGPHGNCVYPTVGGSIGGSVGIGGGTGEAGGGRGQDIIVSANRIQRPSPSPPAVAPITEPASEDILVIANRLPITVTGRRAVAVVPLVLADFGDRDSNCKAAAYLCLEFNPSSSHKDCMDLEQACVAASLRMRRVANDEKLQEKTFCVGPVCVTVTHGGIVLKPTVGGTV